MKSLLTKMNELTRIVLVGETDAGSAEVQPVRDSQLKATNCRWGGSLTPAIPFYEQGQFRALLCLKKPPAEGRYCLLNVKWICPIHAEPVQFGKHSREYRSGIVLSAWRGDRSRCPAGSDDKLSEQKPYTGIDRNRKKFLSDDCRDISEHICRNVFWEGSLPIVRKRSVRCALANPFGKSMKVYWPKLKGKLKSIPIIFSHNLLFLCQLQQFTQNLTGQ